MRQTSSVVSIPAQVLAASRPTEAPSVRAPEATPAASSALPAASPREAAAAREAPSALRRTQEPLGYVSIFTEPWANVRIDGKSVGVTPLKKFPVTVGRHRVQLSNPASPTVERTIQVGRGQTQLLDIELGRP